MAVVLGLLVWVTGLHTGDKALLLHVVVQLLQPILLNHHLHTVFLVLLGHNVLGLSLMWEEFSVLQNFLDSAVHLKLMFFGSVVGMIESHLHRFLTLLSCFINALQNYTDCRNYFTSVLSLGFGHALITSTFNGSADMPHL